MKKIFFNKILLIKVFLIFFVFTFNVSAYVIEPNEVFTDTFESITFDSLVISGTLMFANNGSPAGGGLRQIIITNGDFILAPGGIITQSFDILNLSSNGIDGANGTGGENPTAGENGGDGFGFGFGGDGGNGGTKGGDGGFGGTLGGNGGNGGIGYAGYVGFGDNGAGSEGGDGGNGRNGEVGANGFTVMIVNTTITGDIVIDGNISLNGIKGGNSGNGGYGGEGGGWGGGGGTYGYSGGKGGESNNGGKGGNGADISFITTNGCVFLNYYHNFVDGGRGGNGGNGGDGGDAGLWAERVGPGNDGGNGSNGGNGGIGGSITVIASTIIQNESTSVFSHIEKLSNGGFQGIFGNGGLKGIGVPNGEDGTSGQSGKTGETGYVYFNILSDTNPPSCLGNPIVFPETPSVLQVGESVLLSYSPTNFFDNRTLSDSLRHIINIVSSNNAFGESFLQVGDSDLLNRAPFDKLYFIPVMDMTNQYFLFRFITKDLAGNISTNIFYDQVFSVIYEKVKAGFSVAPNQGYAPLNVNFTDMSTNIPQFWFWDFDNNGVIDSTNRHPDYTYTKGGYHTVSLTVSNNLATNIFSVDTCIKTNYINVSVITNYVSLNGKHIPPFDSWEDAATNIQNAIDIATDYSIVLVSNGIYNIDSKILVQNSLFLKSLSGPENTTINGKNMHRCISVETNAHIEGFKFINGKIDCWYPYPGGIIEIRGKMQNCIILSNGLNGDFGGIVYISNGSIENCLVFNNSLPHQYIGAVFIHHNGTIVNCTVQNTVEVYEGEGHVKNSIVDMVYGYNFFNSLPPIEYGFVHCYNSCIDNFASHSYNVIGNIQTNDFGFVDASNNNYRLLETSPCIDSGSNIYVTSDWDLDGNPRIIDGTVDMGAYEYVPEPMGIWIMTVLCALLCKRNTLLR